ncbi:VIR protein [Plasmodium vivax]|uniref:VIR protein n=1 Tax=Plasmodium vivax TaxID=5855 RepID=A0A1G4ECL4_PLAVI|nr:VIR protein [Plasmodium vivax]
MMLEKTIVNMSIYFLSIKKISKGSNLLINKKAFLIVVMKKNFFYINNFQNFRVPCKKIGEYFSELHDDVFNKDKVMRCKFMNYLINSDDMYNKINEILNDLTELYKLYENYDNIKIVNNYGAQNFTPLGSCIRNRGIKNQKTKDKINSDTLELSYNYDNMEIDSSKDKYNVQYNSV